jgi:hypothetical protein
MRQMASSSRDSDCRISIDSYHSASSRLHQNQIHMALEGAQAGRHGISHAARNTAVPTLRGMRIIAERRSYP